MPKAIWNGAVLAESDKTIVIEGNHYFPSDSINWDYFQPNNHTTVCPWKGVANYYDVVVADKVNRSAAWYYPKPSAAARRIQNYVAFWHGVKVVEGEGETAVGNSLLAKIRALLG